MKPRFPAISILCLAGVLTMSAATPVQLLPTPLAEATVKSKRVGVDEFEKLVADRQNVILDVRTKKEYDAGHIAGAVNIDLNSPDFEKKVAELDKSKTYLVHCAGGVRSARACTKMSQMEFKTLYDLEPGFRGWEKAGKPVERK